MFVFASCEGCTGAEPMSPQVSREALLNLTPLLLASNTHAAFVWCVNGCLAVATALTLDTVLHSARVELRSHSGAGDVLLVISHS